jgi:hypothetical protein
MLERSEEEERRARERESQDASLCKETPSKEEIERERSVAKRQEQSRGRKT